MRSSNGQRHTLPKMPVKGRKNPGGRTIPAGIPISANNNPAAAAAVDKVAPSLVRKRKRPARKTAATAEPNCPHCFAGGSKCRCRRGLDRAAGRGARRGVLEAAVVAVVSPVPLAAHAVHAVLRTSRACPNHARSGASGRPGGVGRGGAGVAVPRGPRGVPHGNTTSRDL